MSYKLYKYKIKLLLFVALYKFSSYFCPFVPTAIREKYYSLQKKLVDSLINDLRTLSH